MEDWAGSQGQATPLLLVISPASPVKALGFFATSFFELHPLCMSQLLLWVQVKRS
jgi:hypothetical protein